MSLVAGGAKEKKVSRAYEAQIETLGNAMTHEERRRAFVLASSG